VKAGRGSMAVAHSAASLETSLIMASNVLRGKFAQ
jgi:hypothetical protein